MHVLLIEDDLNLGKALLKVLRPDYRVEWVRTLSSARNHVPGETYDVLLLDLGLPDGDGRDWIRSLRSQGDQTPVLIISARDEVRDRVEALDLGADDYLVKPFEVEELKARVRVLMRRQSGTASPRIERGNLSYSPQTHQFFVEDEPISLTPKEHRILAMLIHAGDAPVSRGRLTRQLGAEVGSNALEVHIHSLRKLLGHDRIQTVRGFGYRLLTQ